jgi:MoaA/NifB/PqqE/SkfB family radical SAM enzyme
MHSVTPGSAVTSRIKAQPVSDAEQMERLGVAIAAADVVRVDLSEAACSSGLVERVASFLDRTIEAGAANGALGHVRRLLPSNGSPAASFIAELSQSCLRPRSLTARIPLGCCHAHAAASLTDMANIVEIRVPHRIAATPAAGLTSAGLVDLVKRVKANGKARLRATFVVSRRTAGRLSNLVELAAEAGFDDICFDPLFVVDNRDVADCVFFDRAAFNQELDQALKAGKRRNMFVDAVKFGSQGRRTRDAVPGRRRTLVIRFDDDMKRSDGWPANAGGEPIVVHAKGFEVAAVELPLRHMDFEESHFDDGVLRSSAYQRFKAKPDLNKALLNVSGSLFRQYDVDADVYLNSMRLLGIAPPKPSTSAEKDPIAALNEAIEQNFIRAVGSTSRKVVVNLTKPFIGINWGHARDYLLPDQRQFWRTFNQWQVPTVFVAVAPGHDYTVRSIIHNATPGDAIEFLQLSCNGFVPAEQAINWEGVGCVHVCDVPAEVVNEATGKLCVSFTITRQSDSERPQEVGLRSVTIETGNVGERTTKQKIPPRLHSKIKLNPSFECGAAARRAGFGRPVGRLAMTELDPYRSQAADIAAAHDLEAVVEGELSNVAAFAALVVDLVRRGEIENGRDRVLAMTKEIVEGRLDWIRSPAVQHRYSDVDLTYSFFSALRAMLGGLVSPEQVLALFQAIADKTPAVRPAWLAIADCHLAAGRFDEAIAAARAATHRDVCCVISQEVLGRVYRAKFPDSKDSVIDGVPLYDLSDRFCSTPFDRIETAKDGIVWTCCPAWLSAPIGNMHRMEWETAWNSDQAGLMRESILDGSYKYCNSGVCPAILGGNLPKKSEVTDPYFRHYIENNVVKIPEGPREISVSHDPSCNLSCPQCRQDFILADDEKNAEYKDTINTFIKPLIEFAEIDHSTILMSGDGEIFISPHYREVLKLFDPEKHSHVKINLLSNGLVFESGWKKVPNIHQLVRSVTISTDGASEEVYRVTRGGSWKKLYRNLQYISELRKKGDIKKFGIHYAVQTCNYRDMKRMVEIGLELDIDRVIFAILRNGGVYEPADYATRCIFEKSHPDHAEFVKELEDPIFRSPIVDLTQFVGFRGDAVVD